MTYQAGNRVNRIEVRPTVAAVVLNTQDGPDGQVLELAYVEGGTGWWPADAVEPGDSV